MPRLIQYAHAEGGEVVEYDTWLNSIDPTVRECVTAESIEIADGAASVTFTVTDDGERTLSLAAYTLPDEGFGFEPRWNRNWLTR